jgi:hypothetical protein
LRKNKKRSDMPEKGISLRSDGKETVNRLTGSQIRAEI